MTARNDTMLLIHRFHSRGINIGFDDANTLRRAEKTLHRWAELECGDGNNYASW
jgi:aryl carrier-like protein